MISVVIPAYNAEGIIENCLQSVARQKLVASEVIVVDDGSGDKTSEIAKSFSGRINISVLRNSENRGISEALNAGVKRARNGIIARIDADDEWTENHLERIMEIFHGNRNCVLAATAVKYFGPGAKEISPRKRPDDNNIRRLLMWDNPLVHSATAFKREACEAVGLYRSTEKWEDYDLWIRLLRLGDFGYSGEPTARYHVGDQSLSRVSYIRALESRWRCQKRAIRAFGSRHPISALTLSILGGAKISTHKYIDNAGRKKT